MFSAVFKGAPLGNKNAAGKHKAGGLKSHPNYTESDHKYLKGKGYSDAEIKAIWDRDAASGNSGLVHGKTPLQAELDKKGPAGWGNGLPTKNTPLKKGEAMFASVLKSNPKGINQYTKGGGKSADPVRDIESKVLALDTEMETLTKQIDKQKDGATPEQMAKMKSIVAKRRDLMKANASATASSPYSAPYKPTPFLSQKAEAAFSGYPCDLGVVQKANPEGINQYSKGKGSSAQTKVYLETQLSNVQAKMRSGTSSRLVMAGWRKKETEYKNALASFKK